MTTDAFPIISDALQITEPSSDCEIPTNPHPWLHWMWERCVDLLFLLVCYGLHLLVAGAFVVTLIYQEHLMASEPICWQWENFALAVGVELLAMYQLLRDYR